MNLSNASRSMLSKIPGLNRAIDFICARANEVFSQQHDNETGAHTTITGESIDLTGDAAFGGNVTGGGAGPHTFGGDVIARLGSGVESGIGALLTVDGTALLPAEAIRNGLLVGGVANGMFLEWRAAAAPFTSGFELRFWNLPFSTTSAVWRLGNISGVPTLLDGGVTRIAIGGGSRPLLTIDAFTATLGTANSGSGATASTASGTPVTLFAVSAGATTTVALYHVRAGLGTNSNDAANYGAFATIAVEGTSARIVSNDTPNMTITLSGLNVQATQSSGVASVILWTALKIGD